MLAIVELGPIVTAYFIIVLAWVIGARFAAVRSHVTGVYVTLSTRGPSLTIFVFVLA